MSTRKFSAILPQKVKIGDKIQIKAKIANYAEEFSINLANEACEKPQNITYHFKWLLAEDIIVENYKENGEWSDDHRETEYNPFIGRFTNKSKHIHNSNASINNYNAIEKFAKMPAAAFINSNSLSILGTEFALEFYFAENCISVFLMHNDGSVSLVTTYKRDMDLTKIVSIQVCDDVEKVKELTFLYE